MKNISTGRKFSYFIVISLLLIIVMEFFLGVLFYYKDVKDRLVHLDNTLDNPYLYYKLYPSPACEITRFDEKTSAETYKVAIIGGSVATNIGNFKKGDLPALQDYLNKELNTNCIRVINKGVPGYVTEQEYILSQTNVQRSGFNLVFGVDGYNDLASININRHLDFDVIPPQNYREFLVIEQGKFNNSFLVRFRVLFKNINRFALFVKRMLENQSANDYSNLTEPKINDFATKYINTIIDTRDFYNSKGTTYINFLQPIKFYSSKNTVVDKDEIMTNLNPVYKKMEEHIKGLNYGNSLSAIFDNHKEVFTDFCHVNEAGNDIFCREISKILANTIKKDTLFQKIVSRQIKY